MNPPPAADRSPPPARPLLARPALAACRLALAFAAAGALTPTACGGRDPQAAPAAAAARPRALPDRDPQRAWTIRNAFPRLTFQNPVFAVMPPRGGDAWYVGEREGRVLKIRSDEAASETVTVLDLRDRTLGWHDTGLLNLVFHPEFGRPGSPNRGYVYVWYNYTTSVHPGPLPPPESHESRARLSRFTVSDRTGRADPRSELVLIEQPRTNIEHMGGGMFFHPQDHFLYLGVGDGGRPYVESRGRFLLRETDDPQRIDRDLLSGVLRIDVDRRGGAISHPIRRQPQHGRTAGYFIPNDNPWLDPRGGVLEEFFAIGFRNPHRLSHDPGSGAVFAGDVGADRVEEIDRIERGGNYQWSFQEGDLPYRTRPETVLGTEHGPWYSYSRRKGAAAVIGGLVYRGRAHPELGGQYLFGDNVSGQIWARDAAAGPEAPARQLLRLPQEMTAYGGLASFAVDREGEIYLVILGQNEAATGTIQRLSRASAPSAPAPATLSATGLFADTEALVAAADLFPYQVNVPFWSDFTAKKRWLSLPKGRPVAYQPRGEWTFPPGTVAVKHFDLPLEERDPNRTRRLETRVLVMDAEGGAYGLLYKWSADGRDAQLLSEGATERLTSTARERFGPFHAAVLDREHRLRGNDVGEDRAQLACPAGKLSLAYLIQEGDFDVAARWERLEAGDSGLMVREELQVDGAYAYVGFEEGPSGARRLRVEQRRGSEPPLVEKVPSRGDWLRLLRVDGQLRLFTGADGHLWHEVEGMNLYRATGKFLALALRAGEQDASAVVASPIRCQIRDHHYPDSSECGACHTRAAHFVLGASTRQWNLAVPGGEGGRPVNQLVLASQQGLLAPEVRPEQLAGLGALAATTDRQAPLEQRARSYLDVNCAPCHRPGGVAQVPFDARIESEAGREGLIGGRLRWPTVPHPERFLVLPKDPYRSRVFTRLASGEMPPVGGLLPDPWAFRLLREWILDLPGGEPTLQPVRIQPRGAPFVESDGPVRVEMFHPDPEAELHYTTDGTPPGPDTPLYVAPFQVTASAQVHVAAFRAGFAPSPTSGAEILITAHRAPAPKPAPVTTTERSHP